MHVVLLRPEPDLDSLERLRHRTAILGLVRELLKLGVAETVDVAPHRQRDRRDAFARHELHLGRRVEPLGMVARFGEAIREGP